MGPSLAATIFRPRLLWLSLIAYNLGNLWWHLVSPQRSWERSLTTLPHRLVKTGDLDSFRADQLVCNPTQIIPSGSWFNGNCLQLFPNYTIPTNPLYYEGLRGPKWWELDSRLVKNFKLSERVNLDFRAEFYNLLRAQVIWGWLH